MPLADLLDQVADVELVDDSGRDASSASLESPVPAAQAVPCSIRPLNRDPSPADLATLDGRRGVRALWKVRFGWPGPHAYDNRHRLAWTAPDGEERILTFLAPVRPFPRTRQWSGVAAEYAT